MRIACPSCAATYEVPASRLRPGKLVRCASCDSEWLPIPTPGETVPPPPPPAPPPPPDLATPPNPERQPGGEGEPMAPLPEVTAMDRLAAYAATPPRRRTLTAAWVVTFVVLAAGIAAVIGWRNAIVQAWPPSERILGASEHTMAPPARIATQKAE